ncbi:MAG TPA: serine/threonine-protein kinase [Candidatus Obscuribacterales bacterium]
MASPSLVGEKVADKYLVLSELGSGGFGSVYMAKHVELNNPVAIKVLHGHFVSSDEVVTRFRREATATSRLRHNSIASVFDFGMLEDGRPYMVMEYLSGESLGNLIANEGPLSTERALSLFIECCDALRYAHRKGLLHRDIKPDNIFIVRDMDSDEHAKLLDFGLAKILYGDDGARMNSLTGSGMMLGTPWYMSPEQCQALPLDGRSDIYSLAYSLYETLCGHRPFGGATQYETMHNHMHAKVPPINEPEKPPVVPAELEKCIIRALAKSPNDRFSTADEFKDALMSCLPAASAAALKSRPLPPRPPDQLSTPVMRCAGAKARASSASSGMISKSVGAASSTVIVGSLILLCICLAIGLGMSWLRPAVVIKPSTEETHPTMQIDSSQAASTGKPEQPPSISRATVQSPQAITQRAAPDVVAPAAEVRPVAQTVVQPLPPAQSAAGAAAQNDAHVRELEDRLRQLEQKEAADRVLRDMQSQEQTQPEPSASNSANGFGSGIQPTVPPGSPAESARPTVYPPNGLPANGAIPSNSSWTPPTSNWKPGDPLPPGYPAPPWGPPRPEDGGSFRPPSGGAPR